MVNINVAVDYGRFYLDCFGHAMYAEKGKDIVCAGVSALCMALNSVVNSIDREKCSLFEVCISDGAYSFDIHCDENSEENDKLMYCLSMFVAGISLLKRQFKDYITLHKGYYPSSGINTDTSEQTMKKERKGVKKRVGLQIFAEGESSVGEATVSDGGEDAAEAEASDTAASPEQEFEELIRGKYADAFKKRTQSIIDKRFSKMKTLEKNAEVYSLLLESISHKFPEISKADTEGLIRAYLESEKESIAEKARRKESEAVLLKATEYLKTNAAKRLSVRLSEDAEKLREIYPSFDLRGEYASSPEFRALLGAGLSLRRAYEAVNLEKIMGSVLRYAVLKTGKNTADAIMSPGRVAENSLLDRASTFKRTDVKNLTEKEIMEILSQVSRGAKIIF